MTDGMIAVVVSLVALGCQGVNVWLSLRLRVGLLETEKRVLDQVDRDFVRQGVCDERHDGHPARRRSACGPVGGHPVEVGDEG